MFMGSLITGLNEAPRPPFAAVNTQGAAHGAAPK
jgi:hypothetical protein